MTWQTVCRECNDLVRVVQISVNHKELVSSSSVLEKQTYRCISGSVGVFNDIFNALPVAFLISSSENADYNGMTLLVKGDRKLVGVWVTIKRFNGIVVLCGVLHSADHGCILTKWTVSMLLVVLLAGQSSS